MFDFSGTKKFKNTLSQKMAVVALAYTLKVKAETQTDPEDIGQDYEAKKKLIDAFRISADDLAAYVEKNMKRIKKLDTTTYDQLTQALRIDPAHVGNNNLSYRLQELRLSNKPKR